MIPGHPTNTSYRTIAMKDYGVYMCAAMDGCSKNLGWSAHHHGKVDRVGWIHWKQADARASKRGMRLFLKLMAMVLHREWWTEPPYRKLYLANTWAFKEATRRYHFRIRGEWSHTDRLLASGMAFRAKRRKPVSYRWTDHAFYMWATAAGLSPDTGVQSHHPWSPAW